MFKPLFFALGLSTLATASLLSTAPASAMDDQMMTKIDCSQSDTMMSSAAKMGTTTAMTGEIDRDWLTVIMEREKGTNILMKFEAACGKDPKMKAMAAKAGTDSDARMTMFRNQNMSQ